MKKMLSAVILSGITVMNAKDDLIEKIFSLPESCEEKPAPSASIMETLPRTETLPAYFL